MMLSWQPVARVEQSETRESGSRIADAIRATHSSFGKGALRAALLLAMTTAAQADDSLRPYVVVGDAIPRSLTGAGGDAARGRAIVLYPQERFQGTLAPSLEGTGSRWSEGQLRLRMVDASRLYPDTIMPPYYRVDGLVRVAGAFVGKPILTAEQIEDVVAYLMTLRENSKP